MGEIKDFFNVTELRVCVCGDYVFKLKKAKISIGERFLTVLDVAGTTTMFLLNNVDYFQFGEGEL